MRNRKQGLRIYAPLVCLVGSISQTHKCKSLPVIRPGDFCSCASCGRLFFFARRLQRLRRLFKHPDLTVATVASVALCHQVSSLSFYQRVSQPYSSAFMSGAALIFHMVLIQQACGADVQMPRQAIDRHV